MTIKEIQEQAIPKFVRVINGSYYPSVETKEMIGGVFEVKYWDNSDEIDSVWNKDKSNFNYFKRFDLQIVTPLFHKGYQIGIGDMVNGNYEVVGYYWNDGEWTVNTVLDEDLENGSYCFAEDDIHSVTPLYQPKEDKEVKEALELLEKKGIIKDGKIIVR